MLKGIDVSNHNGEINWRVVNNAIDFAMIRAGYSLTKDARFDYNISMCNTLCIPCGVYWFSYALSKDAVLNEAKKCVETIKKYKITFPVAYDWEYDSDSYYEKMTGYKLGNSVRAEYAKIFLDYIKSQGYIPALYTNIDYLNNYGFNSIKNNYDLWLAQWDVNSPKYSCAIWQKSSKGKIDGIKTDVDINIAYKNYEQVQQPTEDKKVRLETIKNDYYEKYLAIAKDIITGKYGNGNERKKRLKDLNIDYNFAQAIVNVLVL